MKRLSGPIDPSAAMVMLPVTPVVVSTASFGNGRLPNCSLTLSATFEPCPWTTKRLAAPDATGVGVGGTAGGGPAGGAAVVGGGAIAAADVFGGTDCCVTVGGALVAGAGVGGATVGAAVVGAAAAGGTCVLVGGTGVGDGGVAQPTRRVAQSSAMVENRMRMFTSDALTHTG